MQLLTGKGLFNIKYDVKTPLSMATATGKTVKKNEPTQILNQFTGSRMGLGKTKSLTSQDTKNKNIGANIGNMVKGIAKPALRVAIKNKSKAVRKR
jgi:hypothetical protein